MTCQQKNNPLQDTMDINRRSKIMIRINNLRNGTGSAFIHSTDIMIAQKNKTQLKEAKNETQRKDITLITGISL